jgi:hypothetical protein
MNVYLIYEALVQTGWVGGKKIKECHNAFLNLFFFQREANCLTWIEKTD